MFESVGNKAGILRAMLFIDGGYLTRQVDDLYETQEYGISYLNLTNLARNYVTDHIGHSLYVDLIRSYYYDAKPDDDAEVSQRQSVMWTSIRKQDHLELRLGRLKILRDKKGENLRQKGVDTLIAIDMLSKAYENHFDVAILLAGDGDFLDVVKSVKNTGKRVYGMFFDGHISQELKECFDKRKTLDKETLSEQSSRIVVLKK